MEAQDHSPTSVYYTEHKPKNKKWGRLGNKAVHSPFLSHASAHPAQWVTWHNI